MTNRVIDLNADLGETEGDLALLSVVTSANVACGGHAGDAESMTAAVESALAHGVTIGAHPSYRDRSNFGRLELELPVEEIAADVADQVEELFGLARLRGATVSYVKLHGALYHRAARDGACAEAILQALEDAGLGPLPVLAQPRAALLEAARARGWSGAEEAFCDRSYRPDGSLVDRSEPGAVLVSPSAAARQAVELALEGRVRAIDGSWLQLRPASLCLHGDTPGALEVARAARRALERAGAVLAPFAGA
ncbi:MAG TPA: 5-oxoprolinase subunit PxpA [Acidimicrobiales bacterium]|nr:5-oxoprolinase subunit PxpA [Acidimicrobiales bacterium]